MGARSWLIIAHLRTSASYQTPMLWSLVGASSSPSLRRVSSMLVVVASAPAEAPLPARDRRRPAEEVPFLAGVTGRPVRRGRSPPQGLTPRRIPRPDRRGVAAVCERADALVVGCSCLSRARLPLAARTFRQAYVPDDLGSIFSVLEFGHKFRKLGSRCSPKCPEERGDADGCFDGT